MTCAEIKIKELNKTGRKIVVWGTGKDSVKATRLLNEAGISIDHYVSGLSSCGIESFLGKAVISADECIKSKDIFFIVAVSDVYWCGIREQLIEAGLHEIADFVLWKMIDTGRKMVMLHGNCHMDIIEAYLKSSSSFNHKYWIYPYERVCNLAGNRSFDCVIPYTDVWIYQPIRKENSICFEVSDEYMLKLLGEDVIQISIPNYYGCGKILFPQTNWGNPNNPPISDGKDRNGLFPRSDSVIDEWVKANKNESIQELYEFCCSDEAFDERDILDNYNQMMEKIFKRDAYCDIGVADFIKDNFRELQMFYDLGHPTSIVLMKIAEKILERLDISSEEITCSGKLCVHEDPVYPQVKRVLGLEWDQEWIRDTDYSKKIDNKMDFKEYIREYLWWCYGM